MQGLDKIQTRLEDLLCLQSIVLSNMHKQNTTFFDSLKGCAMIMAELHMLVQLSSAYLLQEQLLLALKPVILIPLLL